MLDKIVGGVENLREMLTSAIMEALKNSIVNFLKWIALGIIKNSYWICLTACLIALLLYIAGQKKAGKYVSISFIVYFILQALKGVIE